MLSSERRKSALWMLFWVLAGGAAWILTGVLVLGLWGCVNEPDEYVGKGEATLTFLDVGQGLAVLLEQEGRYALFDAGPDSAGVMDSLEARGVDTLEWVALSHNHRDHGGGLLELVGSASREGASPRVHIRRLYVGPDTSGGFVRDSVLRVAARLKIPVDTVYRGDRLALGTGLQFECLWPTRYMPVGENHASVVLLAVSSGDFETGSSRGTVSSDARGSVLLTGDLDSAGENRLLEMNVDLSADLLQVGHHGSAGSSTLRFLDRVSPRYAAISVGADNSYGHPTEEVLRKLEYVLGGTSEALARTDLDGSVSFRIIPGVGVMRE